MGTPWALGLLRNESRVTYGEMVGNKKRRFIPPFLKDLPAGRQGCPLSRYSL